MIKVDLFGKVFEVNLNRDEEISDYLLENHIYIKIRNNSLGDGDTIRFSRLCNTESGVEHANPTDRIYELLSLGETGCLNPEHCKFSLMLNGEDYLKEHLSDFIKEKHDGKKKRSAL